MPPKIYLNIWCFNDATMQKGCTFRQEMFRFSISWYVLVWLPVADWWKTFQLSSLGKMSENCNLIANRGLPHINEHIFSFLDDWSLSQCRGVCQDWKEFIDVYYSKFFYRRLRKRCENDEQFLNRCAIEGFLYVFQVLTKNFKHCSEINPRDDEGWRQFKIFCKS